MNSAKYVSDLIEKGKASSEPLSQLAWETALACVGWSYVFGARGQECTPSYRRSAYKSHGADHPTIKSGCKNFDGTGSCSGCKWFPNGERTRVFDCRGFTYWVLKSVYGWELIGAGATSQWSNGSNWKARGEIATMPKNTLCCLFVQKGKTMEHTGFGLNDETVECSNGVQHFSTRKKKWTHWGVPVCVEGEVPPMPDKKPTLRKGDSGTYVTLLQTMLIQRGFELPKYGADGKFGTETLNAVKAFQKAYGLAVDGVVGDATWAALDGAEPTKHYTVTVPGLTYVQAEALVSQYAGATMVEERS